MKGRREIKRRTAGSSVGVLLCQIFLSQRCIKRCVLAAEASIGAPSQGNMVFSIPPTANIYLTTSWRVCAGEEPRPFSGSRATFVSRGCWWLLQFWWRQRRQKQIKEPFQSCTRSTDETNSFSKLLGQHFKEQRRPGPGRGNYGRRGEGWHAE